MPQSTPDHSTRNVAPTPRYGVRTWLIGLLLLLGVVVIFFRRGDLAHFTQLAQQAQPVWLLVALLLQVATYFCVATVWRQILRYNHQHYAVTSLVPVAVGKLFSDQALPSAGISGSSFFVAALNRRGVPMEICLAAMLVSLVSFYIAYLLLALISLLLLFMLHEVHLWMLGIIGAFCIVAFIMPAVVLSLHFFGKHRYQQLVNKLPGFSNIMTGLSLVPLHLFRTPSLMLQTVLLHCGIFLLDAATLWVILKSIGESLPFFLTLPGFMMASIIGIISPVPMGLGTFEAGSVSMLTSYGIPVESALAATLLLRGFTLWLPMLPGLWLAKRMLR